MATSLGPIDRRAGTILGLIVMVGSSVGCIDGELGTVGATAKLETDVHLTADQPVAVRHLTFSSTSIGDGVSGGIRIIGTAIRADDVHEAPSGVTISARPDDPNRILWQAGHPDEGLPGAELAFLGICPAGCGSGVTVIVRKNPAPAGDTNLRILSQLTVSAPYRKDRSFGVTPTVSEDPDERFDGAPSAAIASASQTIRLTSDTAIVRVPIRIHAGAAVLGQARHYPLVGSLELRGVGDPPTHAALGSYVGAGIGSLIFDEVTHGGLGLASEGNVTDLDWLSRCPASGDCDLAYNLTFSFSSLQSTARVNAAVDNVSSPSLPASFQLELRATAFLEAFDGRSLDPAGLTLTMEENR